MLVTPSNYISRKSRHHYRSVYAMVKGLFAARNKKKTSNVPHYKLEILVRSKLGQYQYSFTIISQH